MMEHDENSQSSNENNGDENIPAQTDACLSNRKRNLILILIIVSLIIVVTVTLLTVFIFIKKEKIATITTTSINTVTTITTPSIDTVTTIITPSISTVITITTTIRTEDVISFRKEEKLKPICLVACVLHKQSSCSQSANTVASSFSDGPGSTLSQLNDPFSMYYDQPNKVIIVGDSGNQRILKNFLDNPSSGGTVIAGGNGAGCDANQFRNTVGVALDSSRQLYVSDSGCSRILIFPPNSNSTTFGLSIANLYIPQGIYIDPLTDDLYVAINGDNSVLKFANGSTTGVVVAGSNGAGDAFNQLNQPNSVYFDYLYTNSLYVLDVGNNRVLQFPSGSTSATSGTMVAGSSSDGSGSNQLNGPRYFMIDSNGILYITDSGNYRVQRWLLNASSGDTIVGGTQGTASNQFGNTKTILFDDNYNLLVVDRGNHRIQLFNITVC